METVKLHSEIYVVRADSEEEVTVNISADVTWYQAFQYEVENLVATVNGVLFPLSKEEEEKALAEMQACAERNFGDL